METSPGKEAKQDALEAVTGLIAQFGFEALAAEIARSGDVNIVVPGWGTVLEWAVMRQRKDIAALLLQAGARVNGLSHLQSTPLQVAVGPVGGREDISLLLVEHGADPNVEENGGVTPLMYAAIRGQSALVCALLSRSANIDARDVEGKTARDWAVQCEHHEVVAVLDEYLSLRI